MQIRHLGGALADARPNRGACGTLAEPYLLYTLGPAGTPELAAAVRGRQRRIVADLGGLAAGRKPQVFLGAGESAADAFPAGTLDRLRRIKRSRDPQGVFRGNIPVLPARS